MSSRTLGGASFLTFPAVDAVVDFQKMNDTLMDLAEVDRLSTVISTDLLAQKFKLSNFLKVPCPTDVSAVLDERLRLRESQTTGRSWVSGSELKIGETVLIEAPLSSMLDVELRRDLSFLGGSDTAGVFLAVLKGLSEEKGGRALRETIRVLHPRRTDSSFQNENELSSFMSNMPDEIRKQADVAGRLFPDLNFCHLWEVCRLNSLGFYTHPECSVSEYERLWRFCTGTGIFPLASVGFNHSCRPNLVRTCIGPLVAFRVCRPVPAGGELTISYIGTDWLLEPKALREEELQGDGGRDFQCLCEACSSEEIVRSGQIAMLDNESSLEIKVLEPEDRVLSYNSLLAQDLGEGVARLAFRDTLDILSRRSVALTEMKDMSGACESWRQALRFALEILPCPVDEGVAALSMYSAFSEFALRFSRVEQNEGPTDSVSQAFSILVDVFGAQHAKALLGRSPWKREIEALAVIGGVGEGCVDAFWKAFP